MATKKTPFTFTKQSLIALNVEINAALAALGKKYGVVLKTGNGTFTASTAKVALAMAVAVADAKGNVKRPELVKAEEAWAMLAKGMGLKPSWLGKTLQLKSTKCSIVGLMPRRKKPVLCQASDGVLYLASTELVIRTLSLPK